MTNTKRCWNWARDTNTEERTLYFNGPISEETWLNDAITPKLFRDELASARGPVTIFLNSPGGDLFAATQIYNALMDYPDSVTVRIDALAASAGSIIAMAGEKVYMSPVSMIMIHNPAVLTFGDSDEMLRAKAMLDETKEAIISCYELKTGLSRAKISHMMDAETWMNSAKAIELGFADDVWTDEREHARDEPELEPSLMFSRAAVVNSIIGKLPRLRKPPDPKPESPTGIPVESLSKRLDLLSH